MNHKKIRSPKYKRIPKRGHGTGCTLSSAIAAYLAKGLGLKEAVDKAISYVHAALEQGYPIGEANFVLDHFFKIK